MRRNIHCVYMYEMESAKKIPFRQQFCHVWLIEPEHQFINFHVNRFREKIQLKLHSLYMAFEAILPVTLSEEKCCCSMILPLYGKFVFINSDVESADA